MECALKARFGDALLFLDFWLSRRIRGEGEDEYVKREICGTVTKLNQHLFDVFNN